MMDDGRRARMAEVIEPFRVKPGSKVNLAKDFDPAYRAGGMKKKDGEELLSQGVDLLAEYQARLAAQDTYAVLVCLQAMDAGGKDGTIRHVMSGVNPQGVDVHGFKVPSPEELDHDYLWRYASRLPARGKIGIFNRSHYEEVLVVRVHPENLDRQKLPPGSKGPDVWTRRYREINDWERYLTDNGFKIVKLYLNLSKEEQRIRFLKRIDLPEKNWKFSANDVKERRYWDDYQTAFSEMLSSTSTPWAPWYVIPADHKWMGRIAAAAAVVHTLIEIDPQYPVVSEEERDALLAEKAALEAEAPEGAIPDPIEAELSDTGAALLGDGTDGHRATGSAKGRTKQRQKKAKNAGHKPKARRSGMADATGGPR
jgi:PPK2 family polyphosphate:nucleotide phosphotransferase